MSAQSKLNQLLEPWTPTDIQEWYTEQVTCQPMQHNQTKEELVAYITRCEICRNLLWLTFREFNHGPIIAEHRLSESCACDKFDGDNTPEEVLNQDLPGMWDESDFLGEGEWAQPQNYDDHPGLTKEEYDRQVAHDKAYGEAMDEDANHHGHS